MHHPMPYAVLAAAALIAGCGPNAVLPRGAAPMKRSAPRQVSLKAATNDARGVRLDVPAGDLVLEGGDTETLEGSAEVVASGPYSVEELDAWAGKLLVAAVAEKNQVLLRPRPAAEVPRDVQFTIHLRLTASKRLEADLLTGSGRIEVTDRSARLHVETGSGDIRLQGIAGAARADTGSGSIHVTDASRSVQADSAAGDIELHRIRGGAEAKSGSGEIVAVDVEGDLHADTSSGDIKITRVRGSVHARSGSGRVAVALVSSDVEAQTSAGDLQFVGIEGTVEGKSGSGSARARGVRKELDVEMASGDIEAALPGSGAQVDAATSAGEVDLTAVQRAGSLTGRADSGPLQSWKGRLGQGGARWRLRTGSGTIRIVPE
jgi:DUF4097 and DUF4098 domain-containing protein YvlB